MTEHPAASPLGAEHFRHVLGHVPTGVSVITGAPEGVPCGMAVNSFGALSLTPPLVLFCPARSSTTWPDLRRARALCINVLAHEHVELCRQFSRRAVDRFAGVSWHWRGRSPALDGVVCWLDCELVDEYDGGDHTIVVSRVLAMELASRPVPLVFLRGAYGTFQSATTG
jgi:3-hydroxy-9,10-secoandrosta-1,3,5(10)-triene-9,17-dione monooxygenase reductase component